MVNAAKPADIAGFPLVGHYWGLLAARNWELIQPLKRPFSTWVQSPSRRVAVNRAPFGAVPTAAPVAAGVDLMFTPGRCKKTISWFSHGGTVWGIAVCPAVTPRPAWGDASAVTAGGTSGEAAADGSAAKNWELIHPLKRPFSTWIQSPSRRVAVNRVPLAAVPRAGPFADGVDLMFTPGRCKKTISCFSHGQCGHKRGSGNQLSP